MKNILWVILLVGFVSVSASAQDDGAKLAKKAKKAITNYFLDPSTKSNLTEAKELIDKAFATGAIDGDGVAWATKGEIYTQVAQNEAGLKSINPQAVIEHPEAASIAYDAYSKSIEKAAKESAKKDAYAGMSELIPLLSTSGLEYFYAKDYAKSYEDFNKILLAHELVKNAKMKSPLEKPEDLNNQYYITALAALNSGKEDIAGALFEKSLQGGNKAAEIYDGLFRSYSKSNPAIAEKYLAEGRAAFPEDNNLLFSEINLYLSQGKLEALLSKLDQAISKEPDNVSVINTLGNVYDKLYQTSAEAGDTTKANEYFKKSLENYNKALTKDPNNNFANYGVGTLYYNKAASYVKLMQSVADDMSSAGMKKYEGYEKQMFAMFDIALPYFIKAEEVDPTDKNTMIALREIYARKNQLDKAGEYAKKLEAKD